MPSQSPEQDAFSRISTVFFSTEGIKLEREALKNRALRFPEFIGHNIQNYQTAIQEALAWLNANGFPATLEQGRFAVHNLSDAESVKQRLLHIGQKGYAITVEDAALIIQVQETTETPS